MAEFNRARWIKPIALDFDAQTAVVAITEHRIAEKRLAKRRPACKLTVIVDDHLHVVIEPKLGSSPTGWTITRIDAVLHGPDGIRLRAQLYDDRIELRRFRRDDALNQASAETVVGALRRLTTDPRAAITTGATNCGWCGRALTDPVSVEYGIGPECRSGFERAMREVEAQMESARPAATGPSAKQGDLFDVQDTTTPSADALIQAFPELVEHYDRDEIVRRWQGGSDA